MSIMKAPTPVNLHPILPSAGYDEMRATRHTYSRAVETSLQDHEGMWEDVWQYIFTCDDTGAERVYGYASRNFDASEHN